MGVGLQCCSAAMGLRIPWMNWSMRRRGCKMLLYEVLDWWKVVGEM